jgi:hypothetical protein
LGGQHDCLETARADFVDGGRIRFDRQAGAKRNLSCGRLANASLHNVAEEDLLHGRRVNFRLLKGALEGYDAELWSSDGFEGTIDGADRGAGRGNNDNFVGTVIRLRMMESRKLQRMKQCSQRTMERVTMGNN